MQWLLCFWWVHSSISLSSILNWPLGFLKIVQKTWPDTVFLSVLPCVCLFYSTVHFPPCTFKFIVCSLFFPLKREWITTSQNVRSFTAAFSAWSVPTSPSSSSMLNVRTFYYFIFPSFASVARYVSRSFAVSQNCRRRTFVVLFTFLLSPFSAFGDWTFSTIHCVMSVSVRLYDDRFQHQHWWGRIAAARAFIIIIKGASASTSSARRFFYSSLSFTTVHFSICQCVVRKEPPISHSGNCALLNERSKRLGHTKTDAHLLWLWWCLHCWAVMWSSLHLALICDVSSSISPLNIVPASICWLFCCLYNKEWTVGF